LVDVGRLEGEEGRLAGANSKVLAELLQDHRFHSVQPELEGLARRRNLQPLVPEALVLQERVVSGQNQPQEASVQPQEVHLAQRSLRVVDLAVDSARLWPQVDLVLRRQAAGSAQHQRQAGLGLLERVVSGQNQPQEALVRPQEVHLVQ
jgi:hypothetical protein